jgi:hypothetical protein
LSDISYSVYFNRDGNGLLDIELAYENIERYGLKGLTMIHSGHISCGAKESDFQIVDRIYNNLNDNSRSSPLKHNAVKRKIPLLNTQHDRIMIGDVIVIERKGMPYTFFICNAFAWRQVVPKPQIHS